MAPLEPRGVKIDERCKLQRLWGRGEAVCFLLSVGKSLGTAEPCEVDSIKGVGGTNRSTDSQGEDEQQTARTEGEKSRVRGWVTRCVWPVLERWGIIRDFTYRNQQLPCRINPPGMHR